jgi:hypothetical protein
MSITCKYMYSLLTCKTVRIYTISLLVSETEDAFKWIAVGFVCTIIKNAMINSLTLIYEAKNNTIIIFYVTALVIQNHLR